MDQLRPRGTHSTPDGVALQDATAEAISLRRQGWTYQRIGDHQGVNVKTAWDRVQNGLRGHIDAEAAALRQVENTRLEAGMRVAFKVMCDPESTPMMRLHAVDMVVRLSERIAKLNGLDVVLPRSVAPGIGDGVGFNVVVVRADGETTPVR